MQLQIQNVQQLHAYVNSYVNTKQHILSAPVGGNYHADSELITACDRYLQNNNHSWTDRADVSEYMEEIIMGCDSSRGSYNNDRAYVQAYLNDL